MKSKISVTSVVIGQPSREKANGVLRYCCDLDEIMKTSDHFEHKFFTMKKRDFIDPFFIIPKPRLVRKLCSLRKHNVIIFHGIYIPIYLTIMAFCNNSKIGLMPHGSFHALVLEKNKSFKKMYLTIACKLMAHRKVALIALTETEKQDSHKATRTRLPILIFGPVILRPENENAISQTRLIDVPRILYIGRYDIQTKGLDTLIEIAKLMKNDKIIFQLRGPSKSSGYRWLKKEITKFGLEKTVDLGDVVFGDEKTDLIRRASLFMLLSRNEGMPLSVIEALSYGCPAVVTEATNVPKYSVRPSPVVFVERAPEDIAIKMRAILSDNELFSQMKISSCAIFEKLYSKPPTLLRIESQLDKLIIVNP